MPGLRFLDAFLYPLRRPSRFLGALRLTLLPNLLLISVAALLVAVGAGNVLVSEAQFSRNWMAPVLLSATLATLVFAVVCSMIQMGYWVRVVRARAAGAPQLPTTQRPWQLFADGLRAGLLSMFYFLPSFAVVGLIWHRPLWFQVAAQVALAACDTPLVLMATVRFAARQSLWEGLNVVGVVRDLARSWPEFLLAHLAVLAPVILLGLSTCCLSLVLLPLAWLIFLPVALYFWLVQAALFGSLYRECLEQNPPAGRGRWLGIVVAGCFLATLSLSTAVAYRSIGALVNPPAGESKTKDAGPYAAMDRHALQASADDEREVASLARYLVAPARNDREKARAIFRWITDRIAYDKASLDKNVHPDSSPEYALRTRLVVCDGYSRLFEALAEAGGLEAEIVLGHTKGHDFSEEVPDVGHAWNAVKLEGRWHILDCTWAAGQVGEDGFHKRLEEFYFLTPPEQMVFTHYPDDPRWQCLEKPVDWDQFCASPNLGSRFFGCGLELLSSKHGILPLSRPCTLQVKAPPGTYLQAELGHDEFALVSRQGSLYSIELSPLSTGNQTLHLYSGNTEDGKCSLVMDYYLVSRAECPGSPRVTPAFQEREVQLTCPRQRTLESGLAAFELRVPGARSVFVKQGEVSHQLRQEGDVFRGNPRLAPGEATVFADFGNGWTYDGLLSYHVR